MTDDMAALRTAVDAIPGTDGWFHDSNADRYWTLAERLVARGVPTAEAAEILAEAYAAAASEYGD